MKHDPLAAICRQGVFLVIAVRAGGICHFLIALQTPSMTIDKLLIANVLRIVLVKGKHSHRTDYSVLGSLPSISCLERFGPISELGFK